MYRVITDAYILTGVVWAAGALTAKRTARSRRGVAALLEVFGLALAFSLLFNPNLRRGPLAWRFVPMTAAVQYAGLAVTLLGLGFTLWARWELGRNWSARPGVKEGHELIQSGPYGLVRHPIYSGIVLAAIGTAIAFGTVSGLVTIAVIVPVWQRKLSIEESLMMEEFGAQYQDYQARVKRWIPGVL